MLVIEKYLGVIGGHEHTQVRAIDALAGPREKTFVTGSDSVPEGLGDLTIHNILSTRKDHKERPEWAITHDVEALVELLVSERPAENVPVLFPTAQTHDVRVCLSLLPAHPQPTRFYLRILVEQEIFQLNDAERDSLRQAIATGTVTLLTETRTMSDFLTARYGLESDDCMLLPCNIRPHEYEPDVPEASLSSRRFRVGYLGGFRKEKGRDLIPDILQHLRKKLRAKKSDIAIDFVIQKPARRLRSRPIKYDSKLFIGAGWPLQSKNLHLTFLPLKITTEEFVSTLRSIDLLLLPYSHAAYNHRGSGIIIDGVLARKPLVYTEGMGMTEFLQFGNAEAASEDPADYAAKIIRVLSKYQNYQEQTQRAASAMEEHIRKTGNFLKSI